MSVLTFLNNRKGSAHWTTGKQHDVVCRLKGQKENKLLIHSKVKGNSEGLVISLWVTRDLSEQIWWYWTSTSVTPFLVKQEFFYLLVTNQLKPHPLLFLFALTNLESTLLGFQVLVWRLTFFREYTKVESQILTTLFQFIFFWFSFNLILLSSIISNIESL